MTRHPLLRCFAFYRQHPWLLTWSTLLTTMVQLSAPAHQHLVGLAFSDVVAGKAVALRPDGSFAASGAWGWVVVLLGVNLARAVVQYLGTVVGMSLGQRLLSDLRDRLFAQVQALDLAWHQAHGAGELITRTTRDCDKVRDAVIGGWRQLLDVTLIVAGSVALLTWYHPLLGLVPALLVAAAVLIVLLQVGRLVALDRRTSDAYDAVTQDLGEGVVGARVIKAFALEPARIARFAGHVAAFAGESRRALAYTTARVPLPQLVVALGHVWVLGFGGWLVAHGRLEVGLLVAAVMVMQALVFRIEPIGRIMQVFADARSSAARITEVLDAVPAIADGATGLPAGPLGVRFDGVRVAAPGGQQVLRGLDLAIRPGEVVALVGATGSGKSTLASLLPRLRDPDAGAVLVGSDAAGWQDLRQVRLGELRRAVQVVYQDSFLFSDTLENNLRLARPEASEAELLEALRLASAGDVLAGLKDGMRSAIGERGVTLSGGQRQRLCLARAIVAQPALICCDDSTSALDAVTERRILDGLRSAAGGATMLLIASKLSTILLADRVVMLDRGIIVASGRHADLARDEPAYRDLLGLDDGRFGVDHAPRATDQGPSA
jgi:ATP-binding cassette subfamily B protein